MDEESGFDFEASIKKALEEGKGWSQDEKKNYLESIPDNHPMFASSAQEIDPTMRDALQSLIYEGETPESLTDHFKERGNEAFKRGKLNPNYYRNAIGLYTEALDHASKAEDNEDMRRKRSQILSNRAMTHLLLKNFRSAKDDANESLKFWPENTKAIYRKAKACFSLKQFSDAIPICEQGLEIESTNEELKKILSDCQKEVQKQLQIIEEKKRQKHQKLNQIDQRAIQFWQLCSTRSIRIGASILHQEYQNPYSKHIHNTYEENNETFWPVLFLYPQYNQSDFIEHFSENEMFAVHLAQMFPAEDDTQSVAWDIEREYKCTDLVIYFECNVVDPFSNEQECISNFRQLAAISGEMGSELAEIALNEYNQKMEKSSKTNTPYRQCVQVHPACTLLQALQFSGHVITGTLVTFFIFPMNCSSHQEFLQKNERGLKYLHPSK